MLLRHIPVQMLPLFENIMFEYFSKVSVPAYDSLKNGLSIELNLTAQDSNKFEVKARGNISKALQFNFERTLEIMTSIKTSWECLTNFSYTLKNQENTFVVKDSKSSSMALAIMLMDIYLQVNGGSPISHLTGTGILRTDGGFDSANLEFEKQEGVNRKENKLKFLTASNCNHIFDLEILMSQTN